jgi:hypothetical protein
LVNDGYASGLLLMASVKYISTIVPTLDLWQEGGKQVRERSHQ